MQGAPETSFVAMAVVYQREDTRSASRDVTVDALIETSRRGKVPPKIIFSNSLPSPERFHYYSKRKAVHWLHFRQARARAYD